VTCNFIARWDGSAWHPLDSGMGGWRVSALTVYDAELIAGRIHGRRRPAGQTTSRAGTARPGRPSAAAMGGGLYLPYVYALAVYNNELIAGGSFGTAAGWSRVSGPLGLPSAVLAATLDIRPGRAPIR